MADVPHEAPYGSMRFLIDLEKLTPIEAGQAAMSSVAAPLLVGITDELGSEERLRVWAGAASAFIGCMSQEIGPTSARCVLEQMIQMLPGEADAHRAGELH